MKYRTPVAVAFALSASLLAFGRQPAPTQSASLELPQASPPALVREQIGLTTVEVEYSRPGVKGRKVFGGLVPYGQVWRTGANAATKVTFSTDVTFGGKAISAGSYALFTIPGAKEWTVILNEVTGQWGSYAYDAKGDVARVSVPSAALGEVTETMSLALEDLRDDSASFVIRWEKTRVAVPIRTNLVATLVPRIEAAMQAEGDGKPYLAAAMFYYEHDVDLVQAVEWIDKALEGQEAAPWVLYRKGLILAKLGEKEAAIEVAREGSARAKQTGGELGAEYVRLCEALVARLQD